MTQFLDDDIDFSEYEEETDAQHRVRKASAYRDDVVSFFHSKVERKQATLPWSKTTHMIGFRPGEVTLWGGMNGHGKALCLETPIMTTTGWKRMGDVHPGDVVFDETGAPCRVVAETDVMENRPCYRVEFSDGSVLIADEQHEWLTKTQLCLRSERHTAKTAAIKKSRTINPKLGRDQSHKKTNPAIVTTKQISESLIFNRRSGAMMKNHAIMACGAIDFPVANLPVDPYILGLWLGDGSSAGGQITTADKEVVDSISAAGFKIVKKPAKYLYTVHGLHRHLRLLGLLNNKHVPQMYAMASSEQRISLLQGLMDSDGSVTNYGRCEFTSTNRYLADAVLWLTHSLGIVARMITGRATLYGKDCGEKYRITFTTTYPVFRLGRKLERVPSKVSTRSTHRWIVNCKPTDSVPVKCIEVDSASHLYLAGRELIPTHNSLVLGQAAIGFARQKQRVVIASMEMQPVVTIARMCRQEHGRSPSVEHIHRFHAWTDGLIWVYDQMGAVKSHKMLAVMRYCAEVIKADHFIIDSLMKCGIAEDDYTAQKTFIDQICAIGKDSGMHCHLVAHSRKAKDELSPPGKMDVKGTGSITDQVDNVITVWRNKKKEADVADGRASSAPDCLLICDKQRNGEWEGKIGLWFDRDTNSFLEADRF